MSLAGLVPPKVVPAIVKVSAAKYTTPGVAILTVYVVPCLVTLKAAPEPPTVVVDAIVAFVYVLIGPFSNAFLPVSESIPLMTYRSFEYLK